MTSKRELTPVLFLDFDGVLHPDGAEVDQLFCHIPMLERALRQVEDLDIVVSSSWREVHPLDEIREYFSPDIGCRVVDVTPVRPSLEKIPSELWSFVREAECATWIVENRPLAHWMALDDHAWRFGPSSPRLLLIDGKRGLTAQDVDQLLVQLNAGREKS